MSRKTSKPVNSAEGFDAAWAGIINRLRGIVGRPDGTGWKTVEEFADESGISRAHAQNLLHHRSKSGTMERQYRKVGRIWTYFYRPVK